MSNILVIDDEPSIAWGISRLGEQLGHEVVTASSAEKGLSLSEEVRPDLVVLDVRLPGMDGLAAMELFRKRLPATPIIIITAFGDLATAVRAIEQGAFEYVLKPFDLHEIRAAVERALSAAQACATPAATPGLNGMLGVSPAMQAVFKRIALVADSDASVLLCGESGVGKELAARAIHFHSRRRDAPFVAVNAAALSSGLAEAELFGHVAGSFTGASASRKGLLLQADSGTLFLDEVADIPLPIQVKLLRALDHGEIIPVGADQPVTTSFRVVSATHQDLLAKTAAGEFRHDLYYRLCAFEIPMPPLRDRREDVALLANHFASELSGGRAMLTDATIAALNSRPWHGNVRELHKAVEHALVLARTGSVLPSHLPPEMPSLAGTISGAAPHGDQSLEQAVSTLARHMLTTDAADGSVYESILQRVERPLLTVAMQLANDSCSAASRALGLHRTTLRKKLDELGLDRTDE